MVRPWSENQHLTKTFCTTFDCAKRPVILMTDSTRLFFSSLADKLVVLLTMFVSKTLVSTNYYFRKQVVILAMKAQVSQNRLPHEVRAALIKNLKSWSFFRSVPDIGRTTYVKILKYSSFVFKFGGLR